MSEIKVKDIHKSSVFGFIFGYCSCGREVKDSENECIYCGNKLIWPDFEGKK